MRKQAVGFTHQPRRAARLPSTSSGPELVEGSSPKFKTHLSSSSAAASEEAKSYAVLYVEPLSEARTPLAECFHTLLEHFHIFDGAGALAGLSLQDGEGALGGFIDGNREPRREKIRLDVIVIQQL